MIRECLQSEIVRLKFEINEEENRYFDGYKEKWNSWEIKAHQRKNRKFKYDLEQKIEMPTLL